MTSGIAVVIGVGPKAGLGAALARRFAQGGLKVFVCGRAKAKLEAVTQDIIDCGNLAEPYVLDATSEDEVVSFFQYLKSHERLSLAIAACNVDSNMRGTVLETSSEMFTTLWRQNALAGFLVGREAVKLMLEEKQGTLFFTGASASIRARPPFTAFAAAKFALRALAQGMAREFGPQGIHVVHLVIDGVINGERSRHKFPELVAQKGDDGLLDLNAIAETYWQIHCQQRSAWTHELDLRPYKETF